MSDDTQAVAVREETPVKSLAERVIELAAMPGTNPEMFDRLVAWQEREEARQAEEQFNEAMNRAQNEIQPVARRTENSQTKSFYAKLEAVDEAIRPIYLRHGFAVSYNTVPPLVPGNVRVECEVAHGRHSKKYHREAPADTLGPKGTAVKTVLHGGGSTETFLKRYAVCGAFNVVFAGMDDDGVRGGMVFMTGEQVAELADLLKVGGGSEAALLTHFYADHYHSLDECPASEFVKLKQAIEGRNAAAARKKAPERP